MCPYSTMNQVCQYQNCATKQNETETIYQVYLIDY